MTKYWKQITLITLLLVVAGCNYRQIKDMTQNPTTAPRTTLVPDTSDLQEIKRSIHEQVNEYRKSQNLSPLTLNSTISEQSKIHSQNMADSKDLGHQGFEGRVKTIAQSVSYKSAAENVATNLGDDDPATQAVRGWIDSPGHQKNMVGDFDLTGVGVAVTPGGQYYFTQMFLKSR
jgi:uncharacterized protein YkwD